MQMKESRIEGGGEWGECEVFGRREWREDEYECKGKMVVSGRNAAERRRKRIIGRGN